MNAALFIPSRWAPRHLFRAAFAALLATAWCALALAELGRFHGLTPLLAGAVAGGVLMALRPSAGATWSRFDGAALLLAIGSFALVGPPHQNLLGGWDPGVYLHTAAAVDRYGTLQFPEEDLLKLTGEKRELFSRDLHSIIEPFGGMRVYEDDYVTPQFYHLYPALLAVLWRGGGLNAALWFNPFLNLFSLLAVYAVLRRLANPALALLGLAVFMLNPAQIWQAGFSTAEMLAQALLWGGFALLARMDDEDARLSDALLAGGCLGGAMLARYDTVMLLGPLSAVLLTALFLRDSRRRLIAGVLFPIAALALHAWAHQKFIAPFYAPISGVVELALLALALLAVALGAAGLTPRGRVWLEAAFRGAASRWCIIVLLAAWWTFLLWIRPDLGSADGLTGAIWDRLKSILPATFAKNLTGDDARIGGYLLALWGWPALLAAMAGTLALFWRERGIFRTAWLAGCLAVAVVLTYRIYNDHFLMWSARRFTPVLVPLFSIGLVLACRWLTQRVPFRPVAAAALLALLLLAPRAGAIRAMATNRDWPGLDRWLADTAAHVPTEAVLVSDQPGFASAFRYLNHLRAFELNRRTPDAWPRFVRLLESGSGNRPVYLLTRREPDEVLASGFELVAEVPMKTHRQDQIRRAVPTGVTVRGGPFALYRWVSTRP